MNTRSILTVLLVLVMLLTSTFIVSTTLAQDDTPTQEVFDTDVPADESTEEVTEEAPVVPDQPEEPPIDAGGNGLNAWLAEFVTDNAGMIILAVFALIAYLARQASMNVSPKAMQEFMNPMVDGIVAGVNAGVRQATATPELHDDMVAAGKKVSAEAAIAVLRDMGWYVNPEKRAAAPPSDDNPPAEGWG